MIHVFSYLSSGYKHMTFHFGHVELSSLLVIAILAFAFYSISPAYAAATCNNKIIFDNSQYPNNAYFFSHSMFIRVTLDPACFTTLPPNVPVQIVSGTDLTGIPLTFNRVSDTSSYTLSTSYVNFTTIHNSNTLGPSIQVSKSLIDTITVTATMPTTGAPIQTNSTSIQGDDFGGPISSFPVPPQPDLTTQPICTSGKGIDGLCNEWKIYNLAGFSGLDIPVSSIQKSLCTNLKCGTSTAEFQWSCNPTNPDPLNPCPKKGAKDVYVEVDFLKAHRPDINALTNVVKSYAAQGIQLHIQVDDEIPFHADHVSPPAIGNAGNTDFDNLKKAFFGTTSERTVPGFGKEQWVSDLLTEKRFAFHYAIFTHSQGTGSGASGAADLPGNDIDISLGNFTAGVGSPDDQAGTFMHELGHNLGLRHGGSDDINCKPNYWSVMNWAMQFSSLYSGTTRPLDYSHEALPSSNVPTSGVLDKTNLNEVSGVTSTRYYSTGSSPLFIYGDASGNVHTGYGGYTKSYQDVMWLPFRSDTSDITNNKNNGIIISGTPTYEIILNKSALKFDGSAPTVNVNYSPSLVPSQITLSAWVYKRDTQNAYLISKWNGGGGTGSYLLGLEGSNNTPVFALAKSGVETRVYGSPINDLNKWHHIAATYDGSTMKIFVDGQLQQGSLAYSGGMNTGTDSLAIGRAFTWSSAATLNGDLDDVQIWNYALSSSDIINLYGGVQPNPQNVLWLPFGGNLFDASNSQNNGILTGGTELYDIRTIPAGTSSTSLIFDGSTTAVNVNYSPSLVPSQITLSAWVYKRDTQNAYLISKWNGGGGTGSYLLGLEGSNNTPVFALAKSGVETRVYASSTINQGVWYHIAGTYDGSTMKIFVNGVNNQQGSLAYSGGMNTGTDSLAIGRAFTWSSAATLNGDLDDVQIWNYALSSSDIINLYGGVQQPGSTLINSLDYEGDRILQTSVSDSYVNQINAAGCSPTNQLFVNGNPMKGFDDWNNLEIDMWNPSWITSSMQSGATR